MSITKLAKPFDKTQWHKVHYVRSRIIEIDGERYHVQNDVVERRAIESGYDGMGASLEWEHRLLTK